MPWHITESTTGRRGRRPLRIEPEMTFVGGAAYGDPHAAYDTRYDGIPRNILV